MGPTYNASMGDPGASTTHTMHTRTCGGRGGGAAYTRGRGVVEGHLDDEGGGTGGRGEEGVGVGEPGSGGTEASRRASATWSTRRGEERRGEEGVGEPG